MFFISRSGLRTLTGLSTALFLVSTAFTFTTAARQSVTCLPARQPVVAAGYEMNIFACPNDVPEWGQSGTAGAFSGPTSIAFDSRGRLFCGTLSGRILILLDTDDNGVVDQVRQFASGLNNVLGITFRSDGDLYCTSNVPRGVGRIIRLRDLDGNDIADETTIIVDNLPSQGDHQTDRLKFGPDGLLYFGQGSTTDDGTPEPGFPLEGPLNATIIAFDPDNPPPDLTPHIFAAGLRQPFGMTFNPETGDLFATDVGAGEVCQVGNCPPEDLAPPEEVNWIVPGGNYGFPQCQGSPTPAQPGCAGVRAPAIQYPQHLTPTSLEFYTGPQAGEFRNQLLLTLEKNLPNTNNYGGDLRRLIVHGDRDTGITLEDAGFIALFEPIDPFDGPLDAAIDPISGDIYVVRFDPVSHANQSEHHHFIYRIHRSGSDSLPFIGHLLPPHVKAGSESTTVSLVAKHLKMGAVVFDVTDDMALPTMGGETVFDLAATLPASLLATERTITLEVRNPDGGRSNQQSFLISKDDVPPGMSPQLTSLFVYKKRRSKIVNPLVAGSKPKKLRLVVDGINFDAGAQLLVNGTALELDSADATEIIGRFAKPMVAVPGDLTVQVRNNDGKVSNSMKLTVIP